MIRILTIILIMSSVHCVYSQKGHGNVFLNTAVVFMPEYEAFEVKLEGHFKPYLDTINMLEKELSDHYYRIPHKSDSTIIANWEIKRIEYEKNIEKYAEFANSLSVQYFQEHRPVFKSSLQNHLDKFCQKNGFNSHDIILEDKRCTDCNDYTEEFINFLKEEYP